MFETTSRVAVLLTIFFFCADSSSYRNCQNDPKDSLLYQRRIHQTATKRYITEYIQFPEPSSRIKDLLIIGCVVCTDHNVTHSTDSDCLITAGGIGKNYVIVKLTCGPFKSLNYDVKIYGQTKKYNGD